MKGFLLFAGELACYLFSPYSPFLILRVPCLTITLLDDAPNEQANGRSTSRKEILKENNIKRSNNQNDCGLSTNNKIKNQNLDKQVQAMHMMNNRIMTSRRNVYAVLLVARIESSITCIRNTFNMARAVNLVQNREHPM